MMRHLKWEKKGISPLDSFLTYLKRSIVSHWLKNDNNLQHKNQPLYFPMNDTEPHQKAMLQEEISYKV